MLSRGAYDECSSQHNVTIRRISSGSLLFVMGNFLKGDILLKSEEINYISSFTQWWNSLSKTHCEILGHIRNIWFPEEWIIHGARHGARYFRSRNFCASVGEDFLCYFRDIFFSPLCFFGSLQNFGRSVFGIPNTILLCFSLLFFYLSLAFCSSSWEISSALSSNSPAHIIFLISQRFSCFLPIHLSIAFQECNCTFSLCDY